MDLGIDVFRAYQTITDWRAVAGHGIKFAWAKASNGGHVATFNDGTPAPADPVVAGARSVGIAPGLYHYALAGDPVAQADVFAGEVIRLGCRGPGVLPPALDLEEAAISDPVGFAVAFLTRLQQRIGQRRVAFYSAASWMVRLLPDNWAIPGLIIWTASYGPNDGAIHSITQYSTYRGRTDVHQYSSAGSCPGITSSGLDMNESLIPLDQLLGNSPDHGEDDMRIIKCQPKDTSGNPDGAVLTGVLDGGFLAEPSAGTVAAIDKDLASGLEPPARWVEKADWDDWDSKGNKAVLQQQQIIDLLTQLLAALKAVPAGGGTGLSADALTAAVAAGVRAGLDGVTESTVLHKPAGS